MYRKTKILLVLCLLLAGWGTLVQAQWFVRAGGNLSWMYTEGGTQVDLQVPRFSLALGLGRAFRLNEKLHYEPSVYYVDLGMGGDGFPGATRQVKYVHALVLDQYLTYQVRDRWQVGISPSLYYVLAAQFRTAPFEEGGYQFPWGSLQPWALSLSSRVGYRFADRLLVYLYYRKDLNAIGSVAPPLLPESGATFGKERGMGLGLHLQYRLGK